MRKFSVPVFRCWDEASRKGFFTKTTWKKRGHNVSHLEADGVVVLKTHRISLEFDTWMFVIDQDQNHLIVTEEWFDVFSEELVLQSSSVVSESSDVSVSEVTKLDVVPRTVPLNVPETSAETSKGKKEEEKKKNGRKKGEVHYDGNTSQKLTQPIDTATTYDLNNPASNTPNWVPKSFNFQDINNNEVKEGLMRLSNLIFLKAHDYPALLETFVPLKKLYLRNQFGKEQIEDIINVGLTTGLFETDNHYEIGVRSIGYRFGESYRSEQFRIININRTKRDSEDLNELLTRNHHLRYLHTHLTSLTIDERALSRFRHDWYIFEPCQSIIAKAFYFKQDDFSGRIHSNLTNLKKAARGLLRLDHGTETLWEVDIANSQPLFAAFASRAKGFNDEMFISLCEQGALYETLAASWSVSRTEAKKETLKLFFAKNGYRSKQKTNFELMFPEFSSFMRKSKSVKHQRFAELAQREERKLIIDIVVPDFIKKCPGAFLATVHDSILVQQRHVEIIRDVITSRFLGQFGVTPTLHVKDTGDYVGNG